MVLLEAAKLFNNLSGSVSQHARITVGARMKPSETRCHVRWKKWKAGWCAVDAGQNQQAAERVAKSEINLSSKQKRWIDADGDYFTLTTAALIYLIVNEFTQKGGFWLLARRSCPVPLALIMQTNGFQTQN